MSKKNSAAPAPSLLLFGVPPGRSRPVGARFAPEEAGIARWLACQRRLRLVTADAEPARRLASRLPAWQLKPDGSPVLAILSRAHRTGPRCQPRPGAGQQPPSRQWLSLRRQALLPRDGELRRGPPLPQPVRPDAAGRRR